MFGRTPDAVVGVSKHGTGRLSSAPEVSEEVVHQRGVEDATQVIYFEGLQDFEIEIRDSICFCVWAVRQRS